MGEPIETLFQILTGRGGGSWYDDESVTQLAHALQCATLAEREGAPPAQIAAALFHDIGHLIDDESSAALERREDAHHETRGANYLRRWFGDDVVKPVRWHVAAKRYLVAVDRSYYRGLSLASIRSLELQGGPFSRKEVEAFLSLPYARAATDLRRRDDRAKARDAATPGIDHFRPYVMACLLREPGADDGVALRA